MSLLTPDNFKDNWYGWVTNQWAHTLLGMILFGVIMLVTLFFGEFANRSFVWGGIAIGYIFWELVTNRTGKWWDSVEDFIFVCVYGSGWIAFAFHEVTVGQPFFYGTALAVVPIVSLFAFHTTLGVFLRIYGKANE